MNKADYLNLLRQMLRIRLFEETIAEILETAHDIQCPVHLYTGQEAVAVGVCSALNKDDYVFSTHRSHGHYLAKGGDMNALMAEIYCKSEGCSHGYGGSMHLIAPEVGFMGSSAIVANSIPLAVGTALASRIKGDSKVSVAFFGDGATNEGVFYESLNFASLHKLSVVFICENNLYSTHMPIGKCLADTNIFNKASMFRMRGDVVNGNNVLEVLEHAKSAVEVARRDDGCTLLECRTYRWRGHVGANYDIDKGLRSQEELDSWIKRCPIGTYEKWLLDSGKLSDGERHLINNEVKCEVFEAYENVRSSIK